VTDRKWSKADFPWDFFALTFGFSWFIWLGAILVDSGFSFHLLNQYPEVITLSGLFGPMFGACFLCYRHGGWSGIRDLFARFRFSGTRLRWWGVVFLLPLAIQALAHFSPILLGGLLPATGTFSPKTLFSAFAFVTILGGGQEEIGWRGYALDRLQATYSVLASSLILGAMWALWHLPLWFIPGTSLAATPVGAFVVGVVSLSVILGWITNNTNRTLAAPTLAHGMTNASHAIFPIFVASGHGQPVYTTWAVLCAVVAIGISFRWKLASLPVGHPR
jgi:membrane protease YdiL (CAAX protease family)